MNPLALLPPDAALLLFTAGVLLIYLELNRPGLILPGAAGLTLSLLALSRFLRPGLSPAAAAAALLGGALLLLSTRTRTRLPCAIAASAALLYAFLRPAPAVAGDRPHAATAVVCALLLGMGTSLLTTIAARARQNKGLDSK